MGLCCRHHEGGDVVTSVHAVDAKYEIATLLQSLAMTANSNGHSNSITNIVQRTHRMALYRVVRVISTKTKSMTLHMYH